jgi:hypothetical protein
MQGSYSGLPIYNAILCSLRLNFRGRVEGRQRLGVDDVQDHTRALQDRDDAVVLQRGPNLS